MRLSNRRVGGGASVRRLSGGVAGAYRRDMTQASVPEERGGGVLFDAILQPHASLSPRGFLILMTAVGAISFAAGVAFVALGAWPVFGFFGLDALLVYLAFKASYRSARRHETVRLTPSLLTIERVAPDGRVERYTFQPNWLRVEAGDADAPLPAVALSSHGRRLEIGAFLAPQERVDFASALREAILRLRAPAL